MSLNNLKVESNHCWPNIDDISGTKGPLLPTIVYRSTEVVSTEFDLHGGIYSAEKVRYWVPNLKNPDLGQYRILVPNADFAIFPKFPDFLPTGTEKKLVPIGTRKCIFWAHFWAHFLPTGTEKKLVPIGTGKHIFWAHFFHFLVPIGTGFFSVPVGNEIVWSKRNESSTIRFM